MPDALRSRLPALIAVAFLCEFALELALLVPDDAPHRALAALLLATIAGGLALGRRAPLAGLVAVFGSLWAITALSPVYYDELALPFATPFIAAYWLGAHASRRGVAAGLALGAALGLATFTGAAFNLVVVLGAPVLIGRLLRSRAALNRALREQAALLERHRADAAGRAVADERTRIAGELHDVVAHALSAMTVQATGARRLALTRPALARDAFGAIETAGREALDELRRLVGVLRSGGHAVRATLPLDGRTVSAGEEPAEADKDERRVAAIDERRRIARELHELVAHSMSVMVVQAGGARRILDRDPARALEAATRIERTGREALAEMRHLLGVLNLPESRAALAPQPTLGELGALVARARAAGLPAMLDLRGERRPLPAGLDLAAYRIVQEALTNALKHAGHAPTTVTVDFGDRALSLEIRDEGAVTGDTAGGGHGLVGMRERVRLYGGEIETGPANGGGWCVRATLPLEVRELSFV